MITDLDFADDIVLLSPTVAGAQRLLTAVEVGARRVGLELNVKKTQYTVIDPDGVIPPETLVLRAAGGVLEKVDRYRYLGVWTDADFDMKQRIGQAWGQMRAFSRVWRSKALSRENRVRLFRSFVEPILLHGGPAYPWTQKRADKMRGTMTKMLRMALNVPFKTHIALADLYGVGGPMALPVPMASSVVRLARALSNVALAGAGGGAAEQQPLLTALVAQPPPGARKGGHTITLNSVLRKTLRMPDVGAERRTLLCDAARLATHAATAAQEITEKTFARLTARNVSHKLAEFRRGVLVEAGAFLTREGVPLLTNTALVIQMPGYRRHERKQAAIERDDPALGWCLAQFARRYSERGGAPAAALPRFFSAAASVEARCAAVLRPAASQQAAALVTSPPSVPEGAASELYLQLAILKKVLVEMAADKDVVLEASLPRFAPPVAETAVREPCAYDGARVLEVLDELLVEAPETTVQAVVAELRARMRERDKDNVVLFVVAPRRAHHQLLDGVRAASARMGSAPLSMPPPPPRGGPPPKPPHDNTPADDEQHDVQEANSHLRVLALLDAYVRMRAPAPPPPRRQRGGKLKTKR